MNKFKKDKLSIFISAMIMLTVMVSGVFFNRLDRINRELENVYEIQKNKHMEMIEYTIKDKYKKDEEFRKKIEYLARSQMRLDLQAVGNIIQKKVERLGKKEITNTDIFLDKIKEITFETIAPFRNYNSEGDYYVVVTIGGYSFFLVDDSEDCAQPRIGGKNILSIPNRTRSLFDEVIWQEEAKLVLSRFGLIMKPNYMDNYNPENINITSKYSIDEKLSNTEVFKYKEIKYIKDKYPEVYIKLKELKIIMHSETELAEKFMNFITFNRSTTPEDNYYWYFNNSPHKEALEVYVVPTGMYGFFDIKKTKAAGVFDEKYVKISIVAGMQMHDYLSEYEENFDSYNEFTGRFLATNQSSLKKIEEEKNKIIKSNKINQIFVCIIGVACFISVGFSFFYIPKDYLNEDFVENFICKKCNK